jgi:large subunit ribosomal protein L29
MKAAKLAEQTTEELIREESSLQEQIFRLRFQIKTGNAENPSKLRHTRRDLARIKTLVRERELGVERVEREGSSAARSSKPTSKSEAK